MDEYKGEERRAEYCPVHHIKCEQWKATEAKLASRVPVWVFVIFISVAASAATWLNVASIERHDVVVKELTTHVGHSNEVLLKNSIILSRATHALNEIALNQRHVMEQLELEFERIPSYNLD